MRARVLEIPLLIWEGMGWHSHTGHCLLGPSNLLLSIVIKTTGILNWGLNTTTNTCEWTARLCSDPNLKSQYACTGHLNSRGQTPLPRAALFLLLGSGYSSVSHHKAANHLFSFWREAGIFWLAPYIGALILIYLWSMPKSSNSRYKQALTLSQQGSHHLHQHQTEKQRS